jgi:TonB-linked SusC/RagA family outer membrane protein
MSKRYSYKSNLNNVPLMKTFLLIFCFLLGGIKLADAQEVHTRVIKNFKISNDTLFRVMLSICAKSGIPRFTLDGNTTAIVPLVRQFKNIPLEDILDAFLPMMGYDYTIYEDRIAVRPKRKNIDTLPNPLDGRVVDNSGSPIPWATVLIKGNKKGVSADADGKFTMAHVPIGDTLVISCVGYIPREMKYETPGHITCVLDSTTFQMPAIAIDVKKGLYSVKKILNTGSVSTLMAPEIEDQPTRDPLLALQGRVPGIIVTQTSGIPGAKLDIRIRGSNSLANGNAPLYLMDGAPYDITPMGQVMNAAGDLSLTNFLEPDNIERIDVLKDADATAIYGSRGANGVVLITSKKPMPTPGTLNFNIAQGIGHPIGNAHLMNTQQYIGMRKEALLNDHASIGAGDYDINGIWNTKAYTDWAKVFIGGYSRSSNIAADFTKGNANTQYRIGAGHSYETTPFPGSFGNTTVYSNAGLHHLSKDERLNINLSLYLTHYSNRLPQSDLTQKIYTVPDAPALYNSLGQLNFENNTFDNPMTATLQKATMAFTRLLNNINLSYRLWKALYFKGNLSYSVNKMNDVALTPAVSVFPNEGDSAALRSNYTGLNRIKAWTAEPQIAYGITKNQHQFDFLLGVTYMQSKQDKRLTTYTGFASDEALTSTESAAITQMPVNYKNVYRYQGTFARIGYNYDERYILNLTARRDGSSRFGNTSRCGNFYAIGAGWVFSKENFFSPLKFIKEGKVRGSIGKTGNDQFQDYQSFDTYAAYTGYDSIQGLKRSQLTNYLYSWEYLNKSELGIELRFNPNLYAELSFYDNKTKNQLVKQALTAISGFDFTIANVPAVVENKGWELLIQATHIAKPALKWSSSFNVSVPRNKLLAYPDFSSSLYTNIYAVGYPLDIRYLYKYTGINPNTGTAQFATGNVNGSPGQQDRIPVYIGPDFYGGFSTTITYHEVTLDILTQFVKQTGYYSDQNEPAGKYLPDGNNKPTSVLARWRKPGDHTDYQRYSASDNDVRAAAQMLAQSSASVTDASFIRLKNVSLTCNLPQLLKERFKIRFGILYLQVQNLITLTRFKGLDPETQRYLVNPVLPPQRMLVMGLKVSL